VPRGLTCGDEVTLFATSKPTSLDKHHPALHTDRHQLYTRAAFLVSSLFAFRFSNTLLFRLPDCTIAAGVRDFMDHRWSLTMIPHGIQDGRDGI
jgi:hypothetical protein